MKPFWTPEQNCTSSGSVDVMKKAVEHIKKIGNVRSASASRWRSCRWIRPRRCSSALPDAEIVDALFVLERLRARKSPAELEMLRIASERVIEFDAGGDRQARPRHDQAGARRRAQGRGGQPRADLRVLPDRRRREPQPRAVRRSAGRRATCSRSIPAATITAISATSRAWRSWASPTPSSRTCWRDIEAIQRAAMKPIKAGVMGGEIYAAAEALLAKSKHPQSHALPGARHGARQPRGAAADRDRPGALRRL